MTKQSKYKWIRDENLKKHSIKTTFKARRREWEYTENHKCGPAQCELCEYNKAKALFSIENKHNGKVLWVDKKCVNHLHILPRMGSPLRSSTVWGGYKVNFNYHLYEIQDHCNRRKTYPDFYKLLDDINAMKGNIDINQWNNRYRLILSMEEIKEISKELQKASLKPPEKAFKGINIVDIGRYELDYIQTVDEELYKDFMKPIIEKKVNKMLAELRKTGGRFRKDNSHEDIDEDIESLLISDENEW